MLDFVDHHRAEHGLVSTRELADLISEHFKVEIHLNGLHRALSQETTPNMVDLEVLSVASVLAGRPGQSNRRNCHTLAGALAMTAPPACPKTEAITF
ncbi:MAG: hypothetical protein OXM02_12910 [Bacteroidota bacterium]|nr:hypothetical protein [Bacteroidota bacterium]